MQSQTMTLATATLDAGIPDVTINRYKEEVNKSTYVGPSHSPDDRSMVQLYRTEARRNGNSRGISKVACKFTEDVSVANAAGDGNIMLPIICELSVAIPLGASASEVEVIRTRAAAFLLSSEGEKLTDLLEI